MLQRNRVLIMDVPILLIMAIVNSIIAQVIDIIHVMRGFKSYTTQRDGKREGGNNSKMSHIAGNVCLRER